MTPLKKEYYDYLYIAQLPQEKQKIIEQTLINVGVTGEDLQNALDSKVADLIDTINIYGLLGMV